MYALNLNDVRYHLGYASEATFTILAPLPLKLLDIGDGLGVLTKRRPRWPLCDVCRSCHTPRAHFYGFVSR